MRYEIHQIYNLRLRQHYYLVIDTQHNVMTGSYPTINLCINNITQNRFNIDRSSFTPNLVAATSDLTSLTTTHPELFI